MQHVCVCEDRFTSINIPVLQRALCNLERLVTFWFQLHFLPPSPVSLMLLLFPSVLPSLGVFSLCNFTQFSSCLSFLIKHFFMSLTCPQVPLLTLLTLFSLPSGLDLNMIFLLSSHLHRLSLCSDVTYQTLQWYLICVCVICCDLCPRLHYMVRWDIRWAVSALWHLMPQCSPTHLAPGSQSAPGKDELCMSVCYSSAVPAPFPFLVNSLWHPEQQCKGVSRIVYHLYTKEWQHLDTNINQKITQDFSEILETLPTCSFRAKQNQYEMKWLKDGCLLFRHY